MTVPGGEEARDLADGLVQLRFSADDDALHDLNAAEVAEVLQGLVELTSQMATAGMFGGGPPPEVRVRPAREGSFLVEAVLHWVAENPEGASATAIAVGGGLAEAIRVAVRLLRGTEPRDIQHLPNGNVKINWPDSVDEVPEDVWRELNRKKRRTRRSLRKLMAPLSDDVSRLEVRSADPEGDAGELSAAEPDVVFDRSDYRIAVAEQEDVEETSGDFEVDAELRSVDFRPDEKWRIRTLYGTRAATMGDTEFRQKVDNGLALRKSDILHVKIHESRAVRNGRTRTDWAIVEVIQHRRGANDDDGEAAPPTPSP